MKYYIIVLLTLITGCSQKQPVSSCGQCIEDQKNSVYNVIDPTFDNYNPSDFGIRPPTEYVSEYHSFFDDGLYQKKLIDSIYFNEYAPKDIMYVTSDKAQIFFNIKELLFIPVTSNYYSIVKFNDTNPIELNYRMQVLHTHYRIIKITNNSQKVLYDGHIPNDEFANLLFKNIGILQ